MTQGPFGLAADLIEAGALDVAATCESVGADPAPGIAGVLAHLTLTQDRSNQEDA